MQTMGDTTSWRLPERCKGLADSSQGVGRASQSGGWKNEQGCKMTTSLEDQMAKRIVAMLPALDEKQKRRFLALEAKAYGWGGITRVCQISGASPNTVRRGLKELEDSSGIESETIRKPGGGRKRLETHMPNLDEHIRMIVDGCTYGDPSNALSYTTLSLRKIHDILLVQYGEDVSFRSISSILEKLGYSRQTNQKLLQVGTPHPDRNKQFEYINNKSKDFIEQNIPVISVDTKKKELLGNFKNNGSEYRHKKDPRKVLDHDFPIEELGKVAPYGVYVLNNNTGFVNLGTDHDTAEFATESIIRWWKHVGKPTFPEAKKLYITCDNGGSNGSRLKLWKYELQRIANATGLEIHVSHFPTGTSKWNKVEHRLFCYISKNWQGKPLINIETVVNLISNTTTKRGLRVKCDVDYNKYPLNKTVPDNDYNTINIEYDENLGNWNYIIRPNNIA